MISNKSIKTGKNSKCCKSFNIRDFKINIGKIFDKTGLMDTNSLHEKKQWLDSRNPLSIVFVAAMALGVVTYLNIVTGQISIENTQSIIGYSYQAMKLSMLFLFALCFWKKSVIAWWVALLYGPILWVVYFIVQPFYIATIIPLFAYAVVVWYLIVKYKAYKDYIKSENSVDISS